MHGIQVNLILDLYVAKCKDNLIEYCPDTALKFIEKIKSSCKKRKIGLKDSHLGIESVKVLTKIMQ